MDDAANRVRGKRIPWYWVDGEPMLPTTPCSEHIYDGACAICRAGDRPEALGAVIEAAAAELGMAMAPGSGIVEATQRVVSAARLLVDCVGEVGLRGCDDALAALGAAVRGLNKAEAASGAGARVAASSTHDPTERA